MTSNRAQRPAAVPAPIIECIPNFSEGRDAAVVDRIADAMATVAEVAVLGVTLDPDHNRSVITIAGPPQAVMLAAIRGVEQAARSIDLNSHAGVHPRLGAADVVPFVPVRGVTLEDCVVLAREAAHQIWEQVRVPCYLYEAAAQREDRIRLENVRRGGFELVRELVRTDPSRLPDVGGPDLHPTAGACIVGARRFLVALNVNLRSQDLAIAQQIAKTIRASSGGMPYVKALGLELRSRGQVQVSMNLTGIDKTPVHVVVAEVHRLARSLGVEPAGTEIIGLLPRSVIEDAAAYHLGFENFRTELVLENRIDAVLGHLHGG